MTIDYSRWDNIDTDSESEELLPELIPEEVLPELAPEEVLPELVPGPARVLAPAPAVPESAAPTTAAHPTTSAPESIQGVILRCAGEKGKFPPWSVTKIQADHPVFRHQVPPIPQLVEVPLVIHRVNTQSADRANLDNQIATYLNIDPVSGLAPPEWQSHVGTVIVARKDKKPLLLHHVEGVWMYCDRILDRFGEGNGAPTSLYNRRAFEAWWKRYCEGQKEFRGGNRGENDLNDWRTVRSPYEM